MKMDMEMKPLQERLLLRLWIFISKPFQVTKLLELLFALQWIWYSIMIILPRNYVRGAFFEALYETGTPNIILMAFVFATAVASWYGLWYNKVTVRKAVLVLNIGVVLFIAFTTAFSFPIATSSGYFLILAALSMLAVWRMDTTN